MEAIGGIDILIDDASHMNAAMIYTIMGYYSSLLHSLNCQEILHKDYQPIEFDRSIVAMHLFTIIWSSSIKDRTAKAANSYSKTGRSSTLYLRVSERTEVKPIPWD